MQIQVHLYKLYKHPPKFITEASCSDPGSCTDSVSVTLHTFMPSEYRLLCLPFAQNKLNTHKYVKKKIYICDVLLVKASLSCCKMIYFTVSNWAQNRDEEWGNQGDEMILIPSRSCLHIQTVLRFSLLWAKNVSRKVLEFICFRYCQINN